MPPVPILSFRGGLNEEPPTAIDRDQCTAIANVEFDKTTLGTRRLGAASITIAAGLGTEIPFLYRHLPTTDETEAELWVMGVNAGAAVVKYKDTSWHDVTSNDTITVTSPYKYQVQGQTLHGKLFLAFKSGQDRLHVRDAGSTTIRRAGLAEPAAPSVGNNGVGSYSGTRYFRVRYTVQDGDGTTLRRSEPSDATTFSPSGSGSGARITKPATISESETHWEIEASIDNANFYRITTLAVGTTTYDDTTAYNTGYAASGTLSEDTGDYSLLHSARFLLADEDRLLLLGSHEDEALSSRFAWTPVLRDPGVGNDERMPTDVDSYLDLDTYEGGPITGGSRTTNGYIYIFKVSHIYQAIRRSERQKAYDVRTISTVRGAIEGSIVEGVDQRGNPAVYFLDRNVGPCRIGEGGIQRAGRDIQRTWATVNIDAAVPARALYDPIKRQVQWWVATNGSDTPNLRLVLQTEHTRQTDEGIRRGWTLFTGDSCEAIAVCLFADNIEDDEARSTKLRPLLGMSDGTIWQGDTGTNDNGESYTAYVRSAPLALAGLINKFGVRAGSFVGAAAEGVSAVIKLIRNFGEETTDGVTVDCSPTESEDPVIRPLDDLILSDCHTVQVEIRDEDSPSGTWAAHQVVLMSRNEETA